MHPIVDRRVAAALSAAMLAFLVGCAADDRRDVANSADPCLKYENTTATRFGRCRLYTSEDGWQHVPDIGRSADLDTQLRCAPVQSDLEIYAQCIGVAPAPNAQTAGAASEPASREPNQAGPMAPEVAGTPTDPPQGLLGRQE